MKAEIQRHEHRQTPVVDLSHDPEPRHRCVQQLSRPLTVRTLHAQPHALHRKTITLNSSEYQEVHHPPWLSVIMVQRGQRQCVKRLVARRLSVVVEVMEIQTHVASLKVIVIVRVPYAREWEVSQLEVQQRAFEDYLAR